MKGNFISWLSLVLVLIILFTGLPRILFQERMDKTIDGQHPPKPGLVQSNQNTSFRDAKSDAGEWHTSSDAAVDTGQSGAGDITAPDTDYIYGLPARCATDPTILMSPEALDAC